MKKKFTAEHDTWYIAYDPSHRIPGIEHGLVPAGDSLFTCMPIVLKFTEENYYLKRLKEMDADE